MDNQLATDMLGALRATSTLVTLTLRAWRPFRTDRDQADKAEADANARTGSLKVVKNLLVGADDNLKAVQRLDAATRDRFRALTSPWHRPGAADDGVRILPNATFFKFATEMAERKRVRDTAVGALVDNWDRDVAQARVNLGSLDVHASDYPAADDLAKYFTLKVDYAPLPDSGGYNALPAEAAAVLGKALETRTVEQMDNAVGSAITSAKDAMQRMLDILGSDKPRVHESLVEDTAMLPDVLSGIASVARAVNHADTPKLDQLARDIGTMMDGVSLKGLRKNDDVKAAVLERAVSINDTLKGWGV